MASTGPTTGTNPLTSTSTEIPSPTRLSFRPSRNDSQNPKPSPSLTGPSMSSHSRQMRS